jgi:hypothetical protein
MMAFFCSRMAISAGSRPVALQLDGHLIAIVGADGIVDGEGLLLLLADPVDAVVGRDLEEPGAERVVRRVLLQAVEGLAEGFDRQVLRIVLVVDHLQQHEVDGVAVPAHQFGVGLLIAFVHGAAHEGSRTAFSLRFSFTSIVWA